MGNLLLILIILFMVLAVVVKINEKYAKPMEAEQQAKFSRIIITLLVIMILARSFQYLFAS